MHHDAYPWKKLFAMKKIIDKIQCSSCDLIRVNKIQLALEWADPKNIHHDWYVKNNSIMKLILMNRQN